VKPRSMIGSLKGCPKQSPPWPLWKN